MSKKPVSEGGTMNEKSGKMSYEERGKLGGRIRAENLSPERRKEISRKAYFSGAVKAVVNGASELTEEQVAQLREMLKGLPEVSYVKELAKTVVEMTRRHGSGGSETAQVYCVAEEAGEFVGAMRRWRGMARRSGTEAEAQAELADVVMAAYVMAEVMGWDLDALIKQKGEIILTRGWREKK